MFDENDKTVRQFKDYFIKFWMEQVTPQIFVVSDQKFRINNSCEGFHNRFNRFFRKRKPSNWVFLKRINRENTNNEVRICKLSKGNMPNNSKKSKFIQFESILQSKTRLLNEKVISIEEFLLSVHLAMKR